jgi:hypothetical protein
VIIIRFIRDLWLNRKYTKILKKVYTDEQLLIKFSQLFGTEFRMDWVGRIYTVINPNILQDKLDTNTQIFEYGENGLSNTAYIEHWIMTKLNIAQNFIMANNLFDLLTYEIKRLDDYDNYLFIIKPITFDDFVKSTKLFTIVYSILLVIGITLLIIF